jgi:dihydrofolate synthase/folylpolyglutamate synthase
MTGVRSDLSMASMESFDDALAYLYTLRTFGTKLGLERIRALLDALGAPDRTGDYLHIAGTNGKGSTAAFLAAILRRQGLRTGLFTSPHLVHFSERIQVDGRQAGQQEILEHLRQVVAAAATLKGEPPTFFEIVTALACCHFASAGCDAIVWETGMGGRLDATNAVDTRASVITSIAYDHTHWLGTTLREIATEKAGIIRRGTPVFTSALQSECLEAITLRARACEVTVQQVVSSSDGTADADTSFVYESYALGQGRYAVSVPRLGLDEARLGILGPAQAANAALAAVVADWYSKSRGVLPSLADLCAGLENARWPARCDILSHEPLLVLDCAHNGASAETLGTFLDEFGDASWTLVFGALADKDIEAVLKPLAGRAAEIWYLKPVSPRGLTVERFQETAARLGVSSLCTRVLGTARELWDLVAETQHATRRFVIAGSCYLAGDVLAAREGLTRDIRVDDPHRDKQG